MTFHELVDLVREKAKTYDPSGVDFLAVQINIAGENEGAFYIEVKDGRINVEPYEYYDRNCAITLSQKDFLKLMDGKLDAIAAFFSGRLKVDGDVDKALEFSNLVKNQK